MCTVPVLSLLAARRSGRISQMIAAKSVASSQMKARLDIQG
jgi:hypothetical protein